MIYLTQWRSLWSYYPERREALVSSLMAMLTIAIVSEYTRNKRTIFGKTRLHVGCGASQQLTKAIFYRLERSNGCCPSLYSFCVPFPGIQRCSRTRSRPTNTFLWYPACGIRTLTCYICRGTWYFICPFASNICFIINAHSFVRFTFLAAPLRSILASSMLFFFGLLQPRHLAFLLAGFHLVCWSRCAVGALELFGGTSGINCSDVDCAILSLVRYMQHHSSAPYAFSTY